MQHKALMLALMYRIVFINRLEGSIMQGRLYLCDEKVLSRLEYGNEHD